MDGNKDVCRRALAAMATGELADFEPLYTPDARNREAVREPAAARGTGPAAFHATARWLRAAHSDLHWEVHEAVADGDLVALHTTMTGRHTGSFVPYAEDGTVEIVFPATGREFVTTQTHWFRMVDGRIAEHWANRDDLGHGRQLGWNPPNPVYLARMFLALAKARWAARSA